MTDETQSKASSETAPATNKKGHPTPTRKEREAAQRKPLVASSVPLTKEQKAARRAELAAERAVRREGIFNGEEKYLGYRDRGPQKRIARDVVDSRFTMGELLIPVLVVALVLTSLPVADKTAQLNLQATVLLVMWALIFGLIIDGYLLGRAATKAIEDKFGKGKAERGIRLYAGMRGMNMRLLRLPKPLVGRGGAPLKPKQKK